MKELEVTVRIRNNRLKERRVQLKMTASQVAEASRIPLSEYYRLESMRRSPLRKDGQWSRSALALAIFHACPADALFPPAVLNITEPVAVRTVDASDMAYMLRESEGQRLSLQSPEDAVAEGERNARVAKAMDSLSPNQALVLRKRFGDDCTLSEVGMQMGISGNRVQQIESKALRILRRRLPRSLARGPR